MYGDDFSSQIDEDVTGTQLELPDELRKRFPNLTLALAGRCGSKKAKAPAIPPATLILFARDGGIAFIVAPKDASKNAHGYIGYPEDLVQQMEDLLREGNVGWKTPSRKRS